MVARFAWAPQEHCLYNYIPGLRFNRWKANSEHLTVLIILYAAAAAAVLANFLLIRAKHRIQR